MLASAVIFPATKKNASEKLQILDLIVSVSNLIVSPYLYLQFAVWLSMAYHFFVANRDSSMLESFNKSMTFCVSILYDTHRTSSFSIKLIFCLKSGFSNLIFCLNLLQLVCNVLRCIHSPINYQLCNNYFYLFRHLLLCFSLAHQKDFLHELTH